MLCTRTCLKDVVVIGLIAALTPVVSAQDKLIWFTDQAEFEAFMQEPDQGKVLKGIEDYEESILRLVQIDVLDDPLESGVPNLPNGFPFPDGLTGLPNLIVQSNVGGGDPAVVNPRGIDGLAVLSEGISGVISDVALTSFGTDSIDLIFTSEKSGVGFNPIVLGGNSPVEVRVYSTTNVFLGMMKVPANPAGTNFIGVWSTVPIGRVNIFDPNNGVQGADNIQAWEVAPPPPGVVFFLNADQFDMALSKAGKDLKGFEDFSENILPDNSVEVIDDPLDANTVDPETFPEGILIDNLTFQSNVGGADSSQPNPRGEIGLLVLTPGLQGATADTVVSNFSGDAFDILSGPPAGDNHTALGLNLISFSNSETVRVDVYDKENNLMGRIENVPAPVAGGGFLGIIAVDDNTIGRINIFDPGSGLEGVYDVAAYFLNPCPWDLDANGSVGTSDLLDLLAQWGTPGSADFDGNGIVGTSDLLTLLANRGPCP